MPGGNGVKIGIIVIAVGIIAYMLFSGGGSEAPKVAPNADDMDLICLENDKHFKMSVDVWRSSENFGPKPVDDGDGKPRHRGSKRGVKVIRCDECDGGDAVLAAKCPDSDTWYPVKYPDGTQGKCPD